MFGKLQTLEHLLKPDLKSCFLPTPPPPQRIWDHFLSYLFDSNYNTVIPVVSLFVKKSGFILRTHYWWNQAPQPKHHRGLCPPALRKGGRGEAGSLQKAMCEWIGAEDEGFGGRWEKFSRFLRAPEGSSGARAAQAAERRGARAPQAGFGREKRGVRAAGGRLGWKGSSGRTGEAECPQDTDK